ncbi:MAG: dCMP deaminase family protein [Candidatus Woesearchaeota archaeon]
MARPTWEEYFMAQAFLVAQRSPCKSRKVGAVLVKDKRVIAAGYNGPPSGHPHCESCVRREKGIEIGKGMSEMCPNVHAEQNCINQLAYMGGGSATGSTIYVVITPCKWCLTSLINAGVKKIVFYRDYPSELVDSILKHSSIEMAKYSGRPVEEVLVDGILLGVGKTFDESFKAELLTNIKGDKK